MLTWLADFSHLFSPLNLFRYITFRTGGATATALFFVFFLRTAQHRRPAPQTGQGPADPPRRPAIASVDEEGHADHGRPDDPLRPHRLDAAVGQSRAPLCLDRAVRDAAASALIGFYDDYLKVTKQTHDGVSGRARLALEAVDRACRLRRDDAFRHAGYDRPRRAGDQRLSSSISASSFSSFGAFVIVAAGNAVNLTDGLDGLAIVPVMIAAATFAHHRLSRRQL